LEAWKSLGLSKEAVFKLDGNTVDVSVLQTKTAKSEVSTPMTHSSYCTNRIALAILRAVEASERVYRKNNKAFDEDARIFVNQRADTFSIGYPQNTLTILSKSSNIKPYTFASQAIANGMSPVEVAKWLGHTKLDMTLNTYSHSTNQGQEKLINFANFN